VDTKGSTTINSKPKIWIDLDNSPHVPFFVPIIQELETRGYSVVVTARDCFQVCDLLKLIGLKAVVIGRHYGKGTIPKLFGTLIRTVALLLFAIRQKPHFAISHGSRAQLAAAVTLRIPNIMIDDYEHSRVSLGAIRPDWLMVPAVVLGSDRRIEDRNILSYPGIKEDVYVPRFNPDLGLRSQFGISEDNVMVTLRPPADEAHYHNPESDVLYREVMQYLLANSVVKIVIVPRNKKQAAFARETWQKEFSEGRILIPNRAVDGLNLIWSSDLVISGGGTMNREAAALGVPVYSIFRGPIGAVDRSLVQANRLMLLQSVSEVPTKLRLQHRTKDLKAVQSNSDTLKVLVDGLVGAIECSPAVSRAEMGFGKAGA